MKTRGQVLLEVVLVVVAAAMLIGIAVFLYGQKPAKGASYRATQHRITAGGDYGRERPR